MKEIDKDLFFVDNMKLEKPRQSGLAKYKKRDFRIQIYIIIAMVIACGFSIFLFVYKPLLLWRLFAIFAFLIFAVVIVLSSLKFPKMKKFNQYVDEKDREYQKALDAYNKEYDRVVKLYEKECGIVKES